MKFENTKDGVKNAAEYVIGEIGKLPRKKYQIRKNDISLIFVAGAPGAGKSEFIQSVLDCSSFIVIDIDEYRKLFEGYTGKNAGEYQDSSSRVATKVFDYCMKHDLKVIFDGTLTSTIGLKNVAKGKKKKRKMGIILIYQDPVISFAFTKARQIENIRNVDIETFLRIYYDSIRYCFQVVSENKNIQLVIASKNKLREWKQKVFYSKDTFDKYYGVEYNVNNLKRYIEQLDNDEDLLSKFMKIGKK